MFVQGLLRHVDMSGLEIVAWVGHVAWERKIPAGRSQYRIPKCIVKHESWHSLPAELEPARDGLVMC